MQWVDEPGVQPPSRGAQQFQRYLSAIWRFKWLVLLLTLLGAAGGAAATKIVEPEYEVQAVVLLGADGRANPGRASGTGEDALSQQSLLDLLVAYQVVDPVVSRLSLFVQPANPADSVLFNNFAVPAAVVPGEYSLRIDGSSYQLLLNGAQVVERGTVGSDIGQPVGFAWQPTAEQLAGRKTVDFTVRTPREKSNELIRTLRTPALRQGSNLLTLRLTGTDAQRTARTLNEWTNNFVAVATTYNRFGISQRAQVLIGQLEYARQALTDAEIALQNFRVNTATLPSESRIPTTVGQDLTANPVFTSFFNQQVAADQLARDRSFIERALTAASDGGVSAEALLSIPSVNANQGATKLRKDLEEALELETNIRRLEVTYTDEAPELRRSKEQLALLRGTVIPNATRALLAELEERGRDLEQQLDLRRTDLKQMPTREIELTRLERQLAVSEVSYRALMQAAQEAQVAEVTTSSNISVLDSAVAPLEPTKKTGPVLLGGGILAGLALGLALAILLDLLDKRFRYAQQATDELGLFILGVVPAIKRKRRENEAAQMVEAFRGIRMNMRYAVDPTRPFAVTISSPGPNDGKSLVASNLALSFADGGARVALVDGDIRRGELARTFRADGLPGLVEFLDGNALLPEIMRNTHHPNLTLIPSGQRQKRAPELLTGPRLTQLVGQLTRDFDVVIVDSPPLGAGSDAYALGIASENMVIVLRAGLTDRKMAAAKLSTLSTLPVRVLGGVLNSIRMEGEYAYYSYYQDYAAQDEDSAKALPRKKRTQGEMVGAVGD
jgi:capsular exopolysaccharide synthesis family protein